MDELTQIRLVVFLLAVAAVLSWFLAAASRRRRDRRFVSLAQAFGSEVTRESEFLSRFVVDIEDRTLDVSLRCIGGVGVGVSGWHVVSEVALKGVSELHSADIRLRSWRRRVVETDAAEFDRYVEIRDAGFPLRNGWLNDRVREAVVRFFALGLSLDPLVIENARLIHRSSRPLGCLDGPSLRELMTRQVALANALERTL